MLPTDVSIREAQASDMPALLRLAELDSRPLPAGRLVIAEAGGRIVAAIGTRSGALLADPFVPTAEVAALLRLRAAQIERPARPRRRLLASLAPRGA